MTHISCRCAAGYNCYYYIIYLPIFTYCKGSAARFEEKYTSWSQLDLKHIPFGCHEYYNKYKKAILCFFRGHTPFHLGAVHVDAI